MPELYILSGRTWKPDTPRWVPFITVVREPHLMGLPFTLTSGSFNGES